MAISFVVARRFVLVASGLAVYAAVITGVSMVLGDDFTSWGSLLDVAIFLGLAYGVYRRSRACAVILFLYQVANRVGMSLLTGELGPLLGIAPLTYTAGMFLGILGTFALHRIAAEREQHAAAAS